MEVRESIPDMIYDLRCYRTWMGEDGIARSVVKTGADIDIDDAIENSYAVNALFAGKKFPLLVNSTGIRSMSKDARNYLSVSDRKTHISAFAVVVRSPLSRVIANFFFTIQKTGVPSKLFNDETEALRWLRKHMN